MGIPQNEPTFVKKTITGSDVWGDGWNNQSSPIPLQGWGLHETQKRELINFFIGAVFSAAKRNAGKQAQTKLRLYSNRRKAQKALEYTQRKHLATRSQKAIVSGVENVGEVSDHPALRLITGRPNPMMYGTQLLHYDSLYKQICGVSYWRILQEKGKPSEIWILPPHLVQVTSQSLANDTPVSVTYLGRNIPLSELFIQSEPNLFDPTSPRGGTSPLAAVVQYLGMEERIVASINAILQNEGRPSGILSPTGEYSDIGEDEAERWQLKYREFIRSGAGGIMVTDNDARFTPLTYKPTDLGVIEIARWIEEQVSKAFQIPVMVLRGTGTNTRAAYQAGVEEWVDGGVNERLRQTEDFLNYKYLPLWGESDLFFCYDDATLKLEEQEADITCKLFTAGLIDENEGRARFGYEPRAIQDAEDLTDNGADEAQEDAQAVLPDGSPVETVPQNTLNGAQIQAAMEIVSQVATGMLPRDAGLGALQILVNLTEEQAQSVMGSVGDGFKPEAPTATSPAPQPPAKRIKAAHRRQPPVSKGLVEVCRKHFARWERAILSTLKQMEGMETKALPDKFHAPPQWAKDLAHDAQPFIEVAYRESGKDTLTRVHADSGVMRVFEPHVAAYAREASLSFAQSTLDTTTKSVDDALAATREAIAEGTQAGDRISDLTDRIQEIFENASTNKAELIAITESARAFNQGHIMAAKDSGVVTGFKWLTTDDPCPICAELNGKHFDIDEDVDIPAHPHCLCVLEDVIEQSEGDEDNTDEE